MIQDGMRTHDEAGVKRYRMPDLLTLEEMRMYFAGTYGVDVELKPLTDDMQEKVGGVGVLPVAPPITDRDREHSELRKLLGIEALENKLDVLVEGRVKELDSRVMTREQFEEKYGPQPAIETPDEKDARLNPPKEDPEEEAVGEDNSDQVNSPVPVVGTEEERLSRESDVANQTDEQKQASLQQSLRQNPSDELSRLLRDRNQDNK